MNEKKLTEKQLGRLRLAYEVQQIANPYLKQGIYSKTAIYLNFVVKEIPICINTFRKMLKEDVSNFPQLAEEYQRLATLQYLNFLDKRRQKRIKS